MLPEHSDRPRQPEPFPVTIVKTPDLPTYTRGQSILVTLRGRPGFNFTGFLIQARAIGSTIPVGTWTAGATAIGASNNKYLELLILIFYHSKVVGCHPDVLNVNDFPDGNDTGAHQTGSLRNIQEMVWTAPNTPGTYRFELTTVEVFGVYWMNQFSSTFTVV